MLQDDSSKDIYYCIRKAVSMHALAPLRNRLGKKQRDIAAYCGINQSLVSKWESEPVVNSKDGTRKGFEAPTMEQIVQLCELFDTTLAQMLWKAIAAEEEKLRLFDAEMLQKIKTLVGPRNEAVPNVSTDPKGADHYALIKKLERSVYLGYFLSDALDPDATPQVEHFILETSTSTSATTESGAVPAFMRVVGKAENGYRCNIVSPPDQRHLYLYMRQDSGMNDRAIVFFSRGVGIQGPYSCGSGAMLSTYRKTGAKRLQWVAIVRMGDNDDELTRECSDERQMPSIQRELLGPNRSLLANKKDCEFAASEAVRRSDDVIRSHLSQPLPHGEGWKLDLDCLESRQKELFKVVHTETSIANDISDCWKGMRSIA